MKRSVRIRLLVIGGALILSLLLASIALAQGGIVHIVRPGDTVGNLAWHYGVNSNAIVAANHLRNPDLIYVGQRLFIPAEYMPFPQPAPRPTPQPAPRPTPRPTPRPCQCEAIVIAQPAQGVTITSPVLVTGLGAGFEQSIVVAVLDGSAGEIGRTSAIITGEYGQQGTFSVTLPFTLPANNQPGRIQVWSVSPRDGAIEHLNSVSVLIRGLELDPLLSKLDAAVARKDYMTLQSVMSDPFRLTVYRAQDHMVSPALAVQQLQQDFLGAGAVRLDFSVDARALLGDRVKFGPEIVHVVYSTGWGKTMRDDAFLLIGDVAGRARWTELLYVPQNAIDYR